MKKQLDNKKQSIVIYRDTKGDVELNADVIKETIWANLDQIGGIFDVQKAAISKHVKNIFISGELNPKATVSKMETVQKEGGRVIKRHIEFYNLDMIIAVGYRINSKKATQFRIWATKTLRAHIIDGYTINRSRISKNYEAFLEAVEQVKKLLPSGGTVDASSTLELIKLFASTWFSLDAYDKSTLPTSGATRKQVKITADDLKKAFFELKRELLEVGQATELFGTELRNGSIAGIVGNILQSFGGKDLYPSTEEKAAHFLYFIVKDHPFMDGNKRSGAFAFVWFLKITHLLNPASLTPEALTALTLLVAESDPKHKDRMIGLVLMLLKK